MNRSIGIAITILMAIASVALICCEAVPLGVPGEWTWARLTYSTPGLAYAAAIVVLAGAGYAAFVLLGDRRIASAARTEAFVWLAGLVIAGFVWLWCVQSAAIEGVGLGKAPYVLYYRRTEGYFWQARYDVASVRDFLRGYEELLSERDYLHIGTHPPGLTALYRGLLNILERSPRCVALVEATEPESVSQALEFMESQSRAEGRGFTRVDAACLWLAALLTQLAAAATCVPLYFWLRLRDARTAAWRTCAFWPLVPALGVFLPKSDVLFPVIGMTAAWLWRGAWLACRERLAVTGLIRAMLGSFVLCAGMLLSLAFLPVLALIGVQMVCDAAAEPRGERSGNAWLVHQLTIATALAGCLLIVLGGVLSAFGRIDLNLISVWAWNLSNHALFYDHNQRTWWKWLLVNPLELMLAVGAPVVCLSLWGAWGDGRGAIPIEHPSTAPAAGPAPQKPTVTASPLLPFLLVWSLLWLSGKNMGEAARLWIVLTPWLVAAGVTAFRGQESTVGPGEPNAANRRPIAGRRLWTLLLVLQSLVAGLTILRVDGFHFTELVK